MIIESKARLHEQTYSKHHRKHLGTHYTPDAIVDYIVTRALQPILQNPTLLPYCKILDPACGSGLFLLKAFDVLATNWKERFGDFTAENARLILETSLYGIDIEEAAIAATKHFLAEKGAGHGVVSLNLDSHIVVGDALSLRRMDSLFKDEGELTIAGKSRDVFAAHSFDCVLGNPPYIRIQNTPQERRKAYSSIYATANGRFDIAGLFLELAEYLLKENGRLGFIVSNKILTTNGAKNLRRFLCSRFSLDEMVDLADTKLFAAAVLPLILIATRARRSRDTFIFSSMTETRENLDAPLAVNDLLGLLRDSRVPSETIACLGDRNLYVRRFFTYMPQQGNKVWTFHDELESSLLRKLKERAGYELLDLCTKISVGLKTTADSVFIKPMSEFFVNAHCFERELVHPVLESHNIRRWVCDWSSERDLSVLYPHVEQNGKVVPADLNAFPNVKHYLEIHRRQLESRNYLKESQRRWYEIWVHQSPKDFRQRKIITPDISNSNKFALDDKGFFVNGTCFYILLKDPSDRFCFFVLGLLNSKIMEYFHKVSSGNSLYAKRFRYWTSYIGNYPIPKGLFDQNCTIATSLVQNTSQLLKTTSKEEIRSKENENDILCYKLFGLNDDEIQQVEKTLAILG